MILSPCLYSLRHGGASFDALNTGIKERGRWASDRSLRQYKAASRAQQEVAKISLRTQKLGEFIWDHLGPTFLDLDLASSAMNQFSNT